jgi:hypothetical protein
LHLERLKKARPIVKTIGAAGPGGQWTASVLGIAEKQRLSVPNNIHSLASPPSTKEIGGKIMIL